MTALILLVMVNYAFTVDWSGHVGTETHFVVEEQGPFDSNFTPILQVGPTDNSVCVDVTGNPGDEFFYRVGGYRDTELLGYSNVTGKAIPSGAVPNAPSNLSAVMVSRNSARFTWTDNSDNETEFRVYRTNRQGSYQQVATLAPNTVSYVGTGLKRNESNCYRISAWNSAGESAPSGETCVAL